MMKIDIKYDMENLSRDGILNIPIGRAGIYMLFDKEARPLYVGIAADLRKRMHMHFGGYSNIYQYAHLVEFCSVIFEDDSDVREVCELYLIKKINPPLNRAKVYERKIEGKKIEKKVSDTDRCNGFTLQGGKCRLRPHANGFCHYHGGNGVTMTSIKEEAAQAAALSYKKAASKGGG